MRAKKGERNKLSLISAVSTDTELYFGIHTDNITGTEIMAFLKHLLKEMDGSIVLLWDNGGPHRRVDVKQFLMTPFTLAFISSTVSGHQFESS